MTRKNHRRWGAEDKVRLLKEARKADTTFGEVYLQYPIVAGLFFKPGQ